MASQPKEKGGKKDRLRKLVRKLRVSGMESTEVKVNRYRSSAEENL